MGGPGVKPGFAASDAAVLFDYTTHRSGTRAGNPTRISSLGPKRHHALDHARHFLQTIFRNSLMRGSWKNWTSSIAPNWPSSWMCTGVVALCRTPVARCSALREHATPSQMMQTGSASIWHALGLSFHESNNSLECEFRTELASGGADDSCHDRR